MLTAFSRAEVYTPRSPRKNQYYRCVEAHFDDALFAATGVTDGELLRGVRYFGGERAETHSVVMRTKTGTVRLDRKSVV